MGDIIKALIEAIIKLNPVAAYANYKDFKQHKDEYRLTQLETGDSVYRHNKTDSPHDLCATCFGNRKRSLLQSSESKQGYKMQTCPHCKTSIRVGSVEVDIAVICEKGWRRE